MTMTTKELLALVDDWRDTEAADREVLRGGGLDGEEQNWHMASAATFKLCADELAPIATALCAEVEALRKDAERYRWLRDSQACALHIEHNDHHTVYESAEAKIRWQENDPKADYFGDVPEDEKKKMIEADSIWTVHIYPNTPVGFNVYHAATLDAAIDAARSRNEHEG